jgi:hypothetical protein
MRDLAGGEAAHRTQRKRYLRSARERGVAAGEHQPLPIVRLAGNRLLELGQLFAVARVAAELVEGASAVHGQQPGAGPLGDAIEWPALQRQQQRILGDFDVAEEIVQDAHQGGGESARLFPEDGCEGGMDICRRYWSTPITGRISTVPWAGQVLAMRRASSRSATVISV